MDLLGRRFAIRPEGRLNLRHIYGSAAILHDRSRICARGLSRFARRRRLACDESLVAGGGRESVRSLPQRCRYFLRSECLDERVAARFGRFGEQPDGR